MPDTKAERSLILNPDFEQQLDFWSISAGTATFVDDSGDPYSGSYCARGIEGNEGSLGRLYQDVTDLVSAGGEYKISGWIRTQGVAGYGAVVALDYVDNSGVTPADGYVQEIGYVVGTTDWTYYESAVFALPPMPSDASGVWFLFDFNAGKGTAWWDDVSLIEVTPPPLPFNPGFEQRLNGWSTSSGTATYTADQGNPYSGSYCAKGEESDEGSLGRLYQDVTALVSPGKQYRISGWIKTEAVVGYVVIALDYVGETGWSPADGYVKEIGYVTGTTGWTYYESEVFTLPPMPADCVAAWFLFDFNAGKGIAWWDDVQLHEIQPEYVGPTILLLINEAIYTDIEPCLTVFEQDLRNEGYGVLERFVTSETYPPEIKDTIRSLYLQYDLVGAILIGDVKSAYCEIHTGDFSDPQAVKIWISLDAADMYYMDLDGYWEHVGDPDFCEDAPPNVIECHTYPSCETFMNEYIVYLDEDKEWDYSTIEDKEQYKAEIWVSRIMGHNLEIPGKTEAEIINDFLLSDHLYRTGQVSVSAKAYLLNAIDEGFQNMDYSGIFDEVVEIEYATKSDYLTCLEDTSGSELLYLLAHSWPQGHQLYDTSVTASELENKNKTSIFYILNTCSAARWDHYVSSPTDPNYLGGLYAFDTSPNRKNYGLGAIGFTGVGGFNWLEYFSDYLHNNPGSTYGTAYKYWFNKNLMHIFGPNNYVYLGDPTIGPRTSSIVLTAESPVDLLVIAPNGLRVGYDSATSEVVNEISGATYSGSGTEPQVIAIPSPLQGVYIIDSFGTGTGTYTITVESLAADGSIVDSETWTETTSPGELDISSVQLFEDGTLIGQPHGVIPEVPVGTILASAAMIVALVAYVAVPKWRRKPI